MKASLLAVLLVVLALGQASVVAADAQAPAAKTTTEISDQKAAEIKKMLRLTGMEKLMSQVMSQTISAFRKEETGVPDEFWKRFEERLDTRELIALMIPLYDKYYTVDDLKAMNAFYESPVGQKVMALMPQLAQESMQIGQEWGRGLGERIARELEAEKKKKAAKKGSL